jgi:hypothetical protein
MIVLGYIGDHKKDTLSVRLGWWLTRWAQSGAYKQITHTESVLDGDNYKRCTIASSSARDGGVRTRENIALTKGHWVAINVPTWNASIAKQWFDEHDGAAYDWWGAAASVLFFLRGALDKFFCNESCAAPFIPTPEQYTPSKFWAIAMAMPGAKDVTDQFFNN